MKAYCILGLLFIIYKTSYTQGDTLFVQGQRGFLFLSNYNYQYDYDGGEMNPVGFHDFFFPVEYFSEHLFKDSNIYVNFKNGFRVNHIENRKKLKQSSISIKCQDTSRCYIYDIFFIIPVVIDFKVYSDNWPLICKRNYFELKVVDGSQCRFEYFHQAIIPLSIKPQRNNKFKSSRN